MADEHWIHVDEFKELLENREVELGDGTKICLTDAAWSRQEELVEEGR